MDAVHGVHHTIKPEPRQYFLVYRKLPAMSFMYSAVVVYLVAFCSKSSVAISCDFDGTNTVANFNDTNVSITKSFQ